MDILVEKTAAYYRPATYLHVLITVQSSGFQGQFVSFPWALDLQSCYAIGCCVDVIKGYSGARGGTPIRTDVRCHLFGARDPAARVFSLSRMKYRR
jgi:hypothetical protein